MLDQDDLKWIATTSTELNTMLQQISRYADLARQHKGEFNYIEMLGERVELASKTAQSLFDRVTSRILEGSTAKTKRSPDPSRPPAFTVVPSPTESAPPAKPKPGVSKPAARAKQPAAEKEPPPEETRSIPADIKVLNEKGNRELILLVDDETEISELASAMLTDEGYKVILARDGFEALRIYQQISKQIGLVILDFFLPVMDGDAVFDELRALNPDVAVVLSSGFAEQSKLGVMLAQGLRGFIPKPYTREKLLEQVRSTLDSARDSSR
ncbi:MAG: two-component system, cell cycle sensor histidine kinase and response regulator CckA [Verrucomicrobiota bacterium]|jgi:CheY-like chemotaxis protein